jgi:hypothetical protein
MLDKSEKKIGDHQNKSSQTKSTRYNTLNKNLIFAKIIFLKSQNVIGRILSRQPADVMGFKSKTANQIVFGLLGAGIILIIQFGCRAPQVIKQPVAYNHSIHVNDVGLDCTECHVGAENRSRATLPAVAICEDCHSEMNGETDAEAFVVAAVENREEIRWGRIYRLPDHVYFSHRRHTSLGKIECVKCHGDIQDSETPPLFPQVALTMEFCMDCHEEHESNNDCLACHR